MSNRVLLLIAFFAVSLWACESPTRGCLDIEAENFDPSADKPCEDGCCQYPSLVCKVSLLFNGEIWKADNPYQNSANQLFKIKSIAFYLSDFKMYKDIAPIEVVDSISLKQFGQNNDTLTTIFRDDFLLFRRGGTLANSPVDNEVGIFRSSGAFNRASLQLGLDADANRVVSRPVTPASHPLARQADSLWLDPAKGYVWMRLVIARDTASLTVPDTLDFTSADFGGNPVPFVGDDNYEQAVGFDLPFSLTFDFYELTLGINFISDPISTWKSKILTNLPNSILIAK
jgi:hypothetical protein